MQELIFVTAQPDVPYFHWQCEVYAHNFEKQGIKPSQIYMIFGMVLGETSPSESALKFKEKGYNVFFYVDDRDKKHYQASIKPYLIYRWLDENPNYGNLFFLHDADIIFKDKPNYDNFIDDNIIYVADTKGYIGYNYINGCCERYKSAYQNQYVDLLVEMTDVLGIPIDCLKSNEDSSGGGQYIIKKTNADFWKKTYIDSNRLYDTLLNYDRKFQISFGGIQIWTAEMWSLLWNLWCFEKETKIIDELNFSWATDSVDIYETKPILHMAGILDSMKHNRFYKGQFIDINPIEKLRQNPNFFDYVDKQNATIKYVEVIKSLVKKQITDYL